MRMNSHFPDFEPHGSISTSRPKFFKCIQRHPTRQPTRRRGETNDGPSLASLNMLYCSILRFSSVNAASHWALRWLDSMLTGSSDETLRRRRQTWTLCS